MDRLGRLPPGRCGRRLLGPCRLQTLEALVCGRRRQGDIAGWDIPAAYHEFVRARQADDVVRLRTIQAILHHNAMGLLTMAELSAHILDASA